MGKQMNNAVTVPGFTPRPWEVDVCETHAKLFGHREKTGPHLITEIPLVAEHIVQRVEGVANARLIAAAPELYECLENIGSLDRQELLSDPEYWGNKIVSEARAVLAKARGEVL